MIIADKGSVSITTKFAKISYTEGVSVVLHVIVSQNSVRAG